ncbi:MAG: hypothetical protein C4K58_02410 [Flavobacteriaceae bacterium]|nr:MAG: hypothetical protein C4K58_02410 [Flavobacteriaceae bacterium]
MSWRVIGTIDTILIAFVFTQNVGSAFKIGFLELATKTILYTLHERVWGNIKLRVTDWGRAIRKSISWRIVGSAFSIGGLEVFTKMVLYVFHEKIWSNIKWGKLT